MTKGNVGRGAVCAAASAQGVPDANHAATSPLKLHQPARPQKPRRLSNLFAPKPLRSETRLGRELRALDPVEAKCKCKFKRTCRCPGCERPDDAPSDWTPCDCCRDECLCGMLHCPHVEEAKTGWPVGVTFDDWVAMLRQYDRASYLDPPPPPRPGMALSRKARVALREVRAAAGLRFWFPPPADNRSRRTGDLDPADVDNCSVKGAPNLRQAGLTLSVYDSGQAEAKKEQEEAEREIREKESLAILGRIAAARTPPPPHPLNPLRRGKAVAA